LFANDSIKYHYIKKNKAYVCRKYRNCKAND
jgi:hypothetical protein